jgi:hypothetical protein
MHEGSDPKVNTDAKKGHCQRGIHAPPENVEKGVLLA